MVKNGKPRFVHGLQLSDLGRSGAAPLQRVYLTGHGCVQLVGENWAKS